MQAVDYDNIFASGDCAQIKLYENFPPKAGVYAVREANIVTQNIMKLASSDNELLRYVPQKEFLILITTGSDSAFGTKWGFTFKGKWVWNMKREIDIKFIDKFSQNIDEENQCEEFSRKNFSAEECVKLLGQDQDQETWADQWIVLNILNENPELLNSAITIYNKNYHL